VRTLHQQREFAVRAALGAGTGRITRHLLVQQLLLVLLAAALGLLLAKWSLALLQSVDVLDSLRPGGMEYRLDLRVAAFASALALAVAALLSIVPSRLVARVDIQQVLRASTPTATGGRWGSRAQQLFVVAQIACAVVLLTGAGLMTKTVMRLADADLGFDSAILVQGTPSYPHPWRVKATYVPVSERILSDLQALPGVAAAASVGAAERTRRGAVDHAGWPGRDARPSGCASGSVRRQSGVLSGVRHTLAARTVFHECRPGAHGASRHRERMGGAALVAGRGRDWKDVPRRHRAFAIGDAHGGRGST
jgi:putative ABC transport system permease protein